MNSRQVKSSIGHRISPISPVGDPRDVLKLTDRFACPLCLEIKQGGSHWDIPRNPLSFPSKSTRLAKGLTSISLAVQLRKYVCEQGCNLCRRR